MISEYIVRAKEHTARRDDELRRSQRISRLRLAAFLGALSCLVWTLQRGADPFWLTVALLLFAVFGVLVVWHARVEDRAAWHDALRVVCERAFARVERRWEDLPPADAPASVDLTHHPYAVDLDLFGRASLFQLLGPAATPVGSTQLAAWLLAPAEPDVVRARQASVAELAPMDDWREQLAAHGVLARDARLPEIEAFMAWAEEGSLLPYRRLCRSRGSRNARHGFLRPANPGPRLHNHGVDLDSSWRCSTPASSTRPSGWFRWCSA